RSLSMISLVLRRCLRSFFSLRRSLERYLTSHLFLTEDVMWPLMLVVMVLLALEPGVALADEGFACGGADVRFSFPTLKLSEEEYPDGACCQWRAESPQLWRSKIPQVGGHGDQPVL